MKALEEIWTTRQFQREVSYIKTIALMLQPCSHAEFNSHPDFVEAFRRFTKGDSFRGMDLARIWSMVLNVKQVLSATPGSLAEVGVYRGQSAALLSFYAQHFERKMYIADTFDGFPEHQLESDMGDSKKAAFKDISIEQVKSVVGNYSGNRWIVGSFPESITAEMRSDHYAFVSVDCDIHDPILECLKFFWPRMVPSGMIFVHDYASGHWPGAKRAVDSFCRRNGVAGMILPDLAGSYVLTKQKSGGWLQSIHRHLSLAPRKE